MESTVENRLQGTSDIFPEDHTYLTFLKKVFRHEFRKNGFRRISTPLLEETSLLRKIYPENQNRYGLYSFHNKDDIDVSLLPSASVGIMRAYMQNEIFEGLQPVYYYYMERAFRQNRLRKEYYTIG
jgi:histidyl-tRNA synthetase